MIGSDDMEECIQKFYVTDLYQLSLKENFASKTLYVTEQNKLTRWALLNKNARRMCDKIWKDKICNEQIGETVKSLLYKENER